MESKEMNTQEQEMNELYEQFNKTFPIEKLSSMTLEEYTNTDRSSSFCYWLEIKTGTLGGIKGGSSYKFGIFKIYGTIKGLPGTISDGEYGWYQKFGKTRDEAYSNIRSSICKVAESAHNGNFEQIDNIDLGDAYKWKIAFLYSNRKLIAIYKPKALLYIAKLYNPNLDNSNPVSELQKTIMEHSDKNKSVWQTSAQLWNTWAASPEAKSAEAKDDDEGDNMDNEKQTDYIAQCIDFLKHHNNIILHGAPGTGKTYLAKKIAEQMDAETEFVQFHPSYDYTDFVEGLRPINTDDKTNMIFERRDGTFKSFCKKALLSNNNLTDNFEETWTNLVNELNEKEYLSVPLLSGNGSFRIELNEYGTGLATRTYENNEYKKDSWISGKSKFFSKEQLYNIYKGLPGIPSGGHDNYRKAVIEYMKNQQGLKEYKETTNKGKGTKPFIFIIDEINRGEISKIFGELFFSIDPGYRGERGRVKTQYQNLVDAGDVFENGFYIPENVLIIGTMNDIDRSVESMDFAMRRRFAFKEITAAESADNFGLSAETKKRMQSLNNAISSVDGLTSAYHIGASYFAGLDNGSETESEVWENSLHDLLIEYLKGTGNEAEGLSRLEDAFFNYNSSDIPE